MKSQNKLLILLLVGVVLRLWIMPQMFIGNDEGNYMYDGKLIASGEVPFRDFFSRSPAFMYLLAGAQIVAGSSHLFVGRVFNILVTALTAVMLYLIAKKLSTEDAGLIAAAAYMLDPFSIFGNTQVMSAPTVMLFLSAAFYFAAMRQAPLAGVFTVLAALTRESALPFLVIVPLYMFLVNRKDRVAPIVAAVGAFMLLGSVYLVFYLLAGDSFINGVFGIRFAQAAVPLDLLEQFKSVLFSLAYVLGQHGFTLLAALLPLCVFTVAYFRKWVEFDRVMVLVYGMLVMLPVFYVFSSDSTEISVATLYQHPIILAAVVATTYLLMLFIGETMVEAYNNNMALPRKSFMLPALWFGGVVAFYLLYSHLTWRDYYFSELLAPIAIAFGMTVSWVWPRMSVKGLMVMFALGLAVLCVSFASTYLYEPSMVVWPSEAEKTAEIIAQWTAPGEEVFTATTPYAILSDRRIAYDISHPIFYHSYSDEALTAIRQPTREALVKYIKENVKYVIVDEYTNYCYGTIIDEIVPAGTKPDADLFGGRIKIYNIKGDKWEEWDDMMGNLAIPGDMTMNLTWTT